MKKKLSIIAVLLLAVVTTAYSVSGTYAKYTSTFNGTSDSVRVAKWAFELNDAEATNTFTFNLFETILDSNGTDTEDNVESNGGDTVIAPGTRGSFAISLANNSEVDAQYNVVLTEVNDDEIPVEYSIDGTAWTDDITTLYPDAEAISKNGGNDTITVQWRWAYEVTDDDTTADTNEATDRDGDDTTLGLDGEATLSVKADITVTQVD